MESNVLSKKLRRSVTVYAKPSNYKGLILFFSDLILYATSLIGVFYFDHLLMQLLLSTFAGIKVSTLFVIGHDAAHGNFVKIKWLNPIVARICFLPSLHNYSLWLIAHNLKHHRSANIKGKNSWSPLSKEEFYSMPKWRRKLEKVYRSVIGLGLYYLVERWWKDKLYPYDRIIKKRPSMAYWLDFFLVAAFFIAFLTAMVFMAIVSDNNILKIITLTLIWPFILWNIQMGFTVYQQHTHQHVPWFDSEHPAHRQEAVTLYMKYPNWFNFLSHNIMLHTAHHIHPAIPLYNLPEAQHELQKILDKDLVQQLFTPQEFLKTLKKCKLYDYENHFWLDFNGNVTSKCNLMYT